LSAAAVIVPGYGQTSEQPIVRAMAARLALEKIEALPISFSRRKPTEPFAVELDELRRVRDGLNAGQVVLIGRSFGGRVCTRLAAAEPPDALILLGHPIAPRGRPRPEDEAALTNVRCPTLIVQGDRDALGPLDVLRPIAALNQMISIYVLQGVGHNFGRRTAEGIDHAATWLQATLRA
jgi:predicted alpha/beta-hydrolase family hydrolase